MLALGCPAQTAFKGQILVSNEHFTLQGSLLRIQMRVSYNGDVLNGGEMLNFTPVLKDNTQRQALSSVVINGKERSKYENRRRNLQKRQRLNIPVVKKDKRQGTYFFDYDTTVAYSDWMTGAALYIESEESGWTGRSHLYEDLLISQISIDSSAGEPAPADAVASSAPKAVSRPKAIPQAWVPLLSLDAAAPVSEKTVSGTLALSDQRQIGQLKDRGFCEAVAKEISQRLESEGAVVALLDIHGFGTPVGNYRRNEQQSNERAQQLKQYLIERQAAKAVTVTWTAEDWQRITELAQADNTLMLRAAALDIMQHVDMTQGREEQLRMLAGGQTYAQMEQRLFPEVRRIDYTATLQHPQAGTGDLTQLMRFYETASSLPRNSSEYNDLIDLAARLHPDHAVAAINAAGVALTKGEVEKAERYLSPWQTDPRAYHNLGLLHLLKGDTAKAEVYLKMAEAQGVKAATEVLASF